MYICIAGKNECAVNALKHLLLHKFKKRNILVLPNNNDKGIDSWQPSLKKFAKKNKTKFGVLTFTPLPVMFFNNKIKNHRLAIEEQKFELH